MSNQHRFHPRSAKEASNRALARMEGSRRECELADGLVCVIARKRYYAHYARVQDSILHDLMRDLSRFS
jgi:hypothetical protein